MFGGRELGSRMPEYAPCPKRSASRAKRVSFSNWGGWVGPALLTHVRCQSCGATYNGKTGTRNTVGIILYLVVAWGIVAGVLALCLLM
jgi:hypothetical protein